MSQIHQEVVFDAPAARVYQALMDSAQHAKVIGKAATISPDEGGAFTAHDGMVVGRNVSLVPSVRIVQAWRIAEWPAGIYSIARFELIDDSGKTRLVFDQDGAPDAAIEHLEVGWHQMYWTPLKGYLAS